MEIGDRIRQRRTELGLSQDELAVKLGYKSRSSINKIELGERVLRQSKIAAIAEALETTPGYIMGWEEEKKTTDPEIGGLDENVSMYLSLNEDHKAAVDRIIQELYSIESGD